MRPPASQVIEQRRDGAGKENENRAQDGSQGPIEPGNFVSRFRLLLDSCEHLGPEVVAEFGVSCGRDGLLEEFFHLFVDFFLAHFTLTSTPRELSFFRNIRTARNTRTFTSDSEIPAAWAMSL